MRAGNPRGLIYLLLGILGGGFAAAKDGRLADAVQHNKSELARALLSDHAEVNATQGDGTTALDWAVHRGDSDLVDRLVRSGANVNASTDLGVTPLYLACMNADGAMVEKLLHAGANANSALTTGESALMTCARTGNPKAVLALVSHGADVNVTEKMHHQTALMWAISEQHPDAARILIEHAADIHARSAIHRQYVALKIPHVGEQRGRNSGEWVKMGGSTPMLFASRTGNRDLVQMMLAAGSDVNETAPDGNTALLIAAHSGYGMLAQWLLDQGADANAAGPGYTALHLAVLKGDRALMGALLNHNANPNARMTNGAPLRRTDPDGLLTAEFIGATPFWLAARFVEPEVMRMLAMEGANPKIATTDGITPLMAAAGVGWDTGYDRRGPYITGAGLPADEDQALAAVRLAIQLGGDVRAADEAGDTALHAAVAKGYGRIVRLLAESGAALNAKNNKGETPLAIARRESDSSESLKAIADLLVKLGAK